MTKFNVGDKVMLTNIEKIMYATRHFKQGDVLEVAAINAGLVGHKGIDVFAPQMDEEYAAEFINGVPTFYIMERELQYIAKVLPPNAEPKKVTEANGLIVGAPVKIGKTPYFDVEGVTGTLMEINDHDGAYRGKYHVRLNDVNRQLLSFLEEELEVLR